jgi:hypothetical protein
LDDDEVVVLDGVDGAAFLVDAADQKPVRSPERRSGLPVPAPAPGSRVASVMSVVAERTAPSPAAVPQREAPLAQR